MFGNHSTDSQALIKPANWGNFAVKPATGEYRGGRGCRFWLCLLMTGMFSSQAQASDWRCGDGAIPVSDRAQTTGIAAPVGPGWHPLSGLDIHAIDDVTDPAFPDVKMRLADVAFVPEYRAAALQWMKKANQGGLEWQKRSDRPDYLGRYAVDIRGRGAKDAAPSRPLSWVEGLLSEGLAMLLPQSGQDVTSLMRAESHAIAKRAGLWSGRAADPAYLVSAVPSGPNRQAGGARSVHDAIGRFVVVEGTLRAVEHRAWRSYLNFGTEWQRDFTIALGDDVRRHFVGDQGSDAALDDWIGRTIRVRGLVEQRGGPYLDLVDPDWLCLKTD